MTAASVIGGDTNPSLCSSETYTFRLRVLSAELHRFDAFERIQNILQPGMVAAESKHNPPIVAGYCQIGQRPVYGGVRNPHVMKTPRGCKAPNFASRRVQGLPERKPSGENGWLKRQG